MDNRKVIEKILHSIDLQTELENKLFKARTEQQIEVIDGITVRFSIECENNYFYDVSKIADPLLSALREMLGISEDSFTADDVTDIARNECVPIQERVERLMKLNE